MTRFHFNSADGKTIVDEDGIECSDQDSARVEASCLLAGMLRDQPRHPWEHGGLSVTVTDDGGLTLFTLAVVAVDTPTTSKRR